MVCSGVDPGRAQGGGKWVRGHRDGEGSGCAECGGRPFGEGTNELHGAELCMGRERPERVLDDGARRGEQSEVELGGAKLERSKDLSRIGC